MKLSFIGLGVMGYPMAGHLKRAGHDVTVFNRTAARAGDWVEGVWRRVRAHAGTSRKGDADIVFSCVGRDADLRQVTLEKDGAFAAMKPGAVFVDHTTASATIARELAAAAQKAGFDFLDAPVSGGAGGRVNGKLTIMCGGKRESLCAGRAGDGGLCPPDAACWDRPALASSPRWSTRFALPASCRAWRKASAWHAPPAWISRRWSR